MTIPPRFLDELRHRLTLSEIIGKRIKVTRAGREYKACCPFHHEKTPSFTINDQKHFYHCFGCGAHGDVVGFVMQHDNLSFPDAVEMLAAMAGLQMPKPDPEAVQKAEKQKDLYSLMEEATKYFESCLDGAPLKYLQDRGTQDQTLKSFRVGFAPADGQEVRKHLKLKGYTDAQMLEAGVIKASQKGTEPYAFFRERIMFPVADRRGRVVAFGGRILPDHLRPPDRGDFKPPKYINSSDTPLFDKGRMLYAESLARQAVRDGRTLIVTEGYMDVIACHQAGFSGAVAPMGTALTEDQILSLWSMCPDEEKVPVLCFDGDNAGRRAASRACERILPLIKPGQSARFAFLPEGEDPDTLIRARGGEAFGAAIDSALSLLDFLWASHTAGRSFETPEARAALTKALQETISVIPERDVQAHYRRLIQDRISETFFPRRQPQSTARPYGKKQQNPAASGLKVRKPARDKGALQARIVLATLLNHPYLYDSLEEVFGQYEVMSSSLGAVMQEAMMALEMEPALDRGALRNHLLNKGFGQEVGDILHESVYVHASFCAPQADSGLVESQFLAWLKDIRERDWGEINTGWKQAFKDSDEEYEKKLQEMVRVKSST